MSDNTNFVDLSQFDEPLAAGDEPIFDPTATQSGPPPIPESKDGYIAILRFAKDKAEEWWTKKEENGVAKYLYTNIVAEILTGQYEGRKVRDFVSTQVNQFDKTTRTNLILQALGNPVTAADVAKMGAHKANASKFQEAILGEPTAKIFVQWQAKFLIEGEGGKKEALTTINEKGKTVQIQLRGATKSDWPKDAEGNPRTHFTLAEAKPDFAGTDYANIPATVEAAIIRYAANVQ